MRRRSPPFSCTSFLPPRLTWRPSAVRRRLMPARAAPPPMIPNGRTARRSDSMHAVIGRRNSICMQYRMCSGREPPHKLPFHDEICKSGLYLRLSLMHNKQLMLTGGMLKLSYIYRYRIQSPTSLTTPSPPLNFPGPPEPGRSENSRNTTGYRLSSISAQSEGDSDAAIALST